MQAFGGPGRTALGFTPAYSMHPIISETVGTTWVDGAAGAGPRRPLRPDRGSAVEQVREHQPNVVFLCSPNNPTGTALALDVVEAVYDAAQDAVVVVDEAYAEFAREGTPSALTLLAGRERLVVTRTMSKAFAFAGGRLGYLAANPALTDALRLVRLPYHLSSPTQAIALAALRHAPEMLGDGRGRSRSSATGSSPSSPRLGLAPVPSDANFVLFGGLADARADLAALLDRGVLVRDVGIPALSSCHGRDPGRDRCLPGRHRRDRPTRHDRSASAMSRPPDRTASLSRTTSESPASSSSSTSTGPGSRRRQHRRALLRPHARCRWPSTR